jgi:hypothetical protein
MKIKKETNKQTESGAFKVCKTRILLFLFPLSRESHNHRPESIQAASTAATRWYGDGIGGSLLPKRWWRRE